ncbi:chromosome segregation in meiosis- protein [Microbotryomycetes sp. JL221]|nr:chromosome segregation in meiosis- protein [Microbotryomycetes sp. JL221]
MSSSDSEDADVKAVAAKRAQRSRPLFNDDDELEDRDAAHPLLARPPRPRRVAHFLGAEDDDGHQVRLEGGEDLLDDLFGDLGGIVNGPEDLGNRDATNDPADLDKVVNNDGGGEDIDKVAKARKQRAKMDEHRLLGPKGFSRLLQDVKRFKPRGKGHEHADLRRVMTLYQLWSHQMYPRTNLRDTLKTVERLCHKQIVKRGLKQLREDAKPSNSVQEEENDDGLDQEPAVGDHDQPQDIATGGVRQITSAGLENDDTAVWNEFQDDMFADEDDLLRELEEQAGASQARASDPTQDKEHAVDRKQAASEDADLGDADANDEDEDAEAAMREALDF